MAQSFAQSVDQCVLPGGHPLEPLSADEVHAAVSILRTAGKATPTTRFVSVSLHEPPKDLVYASTGPIRPPRQAFVVLFDNATNACHEAVVSIQEGTLESWRHIPGVQPTMTVDEQVECEAAVLASVEFRDALARHHGIHDMRLVMGVTDRIVVLEDGKVVEDGNHAALLARNGVYARLWNRQAGGFM